MLFNKMRVPLVRRICAAMLAVCMVTGLISGTAQASGGESGFTDIAENAPYYDAVCYVVENGLMNGVSETSFAPDGLINRALLATALYRLEDSPSVSGASFSDVEPGSWYSDAVSWVTAYDLVSGYGDGRFGPDDPVTREQIAVIFYRYAQFKGYDTRIFDGNLNDFEDAPAVQPYALEAMRWAVGCGLLYGVGGILAPTKSATRAHLAVAVQTLGVMKTYISMAEQRKDEIRSTVTDCTKDVTGTIYYISNSGSDENDGRLPETAWATPYRAMQEPMNAGDAVLFARGDTWYIGVEKNTGSTECNLHFADGVSVGAYGEGPKPILRGDIEEANAPGFWEIYYDEGGVKIWKAVQALRDTNVIVFNEGESWAEEIFPWWDGDMQYITSDGTLFDVKEALDRDLTFCNLLDLKRDHTCFKERIDPYFTGELYLRCDAGNPADVYDIVSVPQEIVGIEILPHSRIRDLDIRYCVMMGTQATDYYGTPMEFYRFSNLEIGWCGGWLQNYIPLVDENGTQHGYQPHIAGGGIGVYSTELSVTDCYIHHCGPMALILSMHDHSRDTAEVTTFKNQRFAGNLFEYCAAPMHWTDLTTMDNPGSKGFLSNLVYENNLVMYTGDGWLHNSILYSEGGGPFNIWLSPVENLMGAADNDGIIIRNNVFFLSRGSMVSLREYLWDGVTPVNRQPVFSGNTYIQLGDRLLFWWFYAGWSWFPSEKVLERQLGDTEGTLIVLGQNPHSPGWTPLQAEYHGDGTVSIRLETEAAGVCVFAAYDRNGKAIEHILMEKAETDENVVSLSFAVPSSAVTVKAFVLDPDTYQPVTFPFEADIWYPYSE